MRDYSVYTAAGAVAKFVVRGYSHLSVVSSIQQYFIAVISIKQGMNGYQLAPTSCALMKTTEYTKCGDPAQNVPVIEKIAVENANIRTCCLSRMRISI